MRSSSPLACSAAFVALAVLGCRTHVSPAPHEAPAAPASAPAEAEHQAAPAPEPESTNLPSPVAKAGETPKTPNAILVTIDGVRWQDVFNEGRTSEELMPRSWALIRRSGVALGHGPSCGVVRPHNATHISLPGYLEIFTGRLPKCMSNVCANVKVPTVLDAAAAAGLTTASIGSWEMLSAAASRGRTGVFVSAGTRWPGPRPLEDRKLEELVAVGEKAKPFPAPDGTYRPDRFTAAIALEYLRVYRPRLLHVGLGDTDEYGHRDNRAGYDGALRDADAFIGALADELEKLDLFSRTSVLVTADHGRANLFREHGPKYPESGRAFVLAFGGRVAKRGEVCARANLWLTDIAPTLRQLLDLPPDTSSEVVGRPILDVFGP